MSLEQEWKDVIALNTIDIAKLKVKVEYLELMLGKKEVKE